MTGHSPTDLAHALAVYQEHGPRGGAEDRHTGRHGHRLGEAHRRADGGR